MFSRKFAFVLLCALTNRTSCTLHVFQQIEPDFFLSYQCTAEISDGTMAVISKGYDAEIRVYRLEESTLEWQLNSTIRKQSRNEDFLSIAGDVIVTGSTHQSTLSIYQSHLGTWNHLENLSLNFPIQRKSQISLSSDTLMIADPDRKTLVVFERDLNQTNRWSHFVDLKSTKSKWYEKWNSVSFDGNFAAAGSDSNEITIFHRVGGSWTFLKTFGTNLPGFSGEVISLNDGVLTIGVGEDTCHGGVQVFEMNAGGSRNWGSVAVLFPPDKYRSTCETFGYSVKVEHNVILVGMPHWKSTANNIRGGAFLFERDHFTQRWTLVEVLDFSDTKGWVDEVGLSVSISSNLIVVGAVGSSVFPFYFRQELRSFLSLSPTFNPTLTPTNSPTQHPSDSPRPSQTPTPGSQRQSQNISQTILTTFSCLFACCVLIFNHCYKLGISTKTHVFQETQESNTVLD